MTEELNLLKAQENYKQAVKVLEDESKELVKGFLSLYKVGQLFKDSKGDVWVLCRDPLGTDGAMQLSRLIADYTEPITAKNIETLTQKFDNLVEAFQLDKSLLD